MKKIIILILMILLLLTGCGKSNDDNEEVIDNPVVEDDNNHSYSEKLVLLSEDIDAGITPTLKIEGDRWPCSETELIEAWEKFYPLMVKVLGPIDESFYTDGLTWRMNDETLSHHVNEQFPDSNTIEMGIEVASRDVEQCISGLIHETGHMWIQKNNEGINFDGQWFWEGATNICGVILDLDGYFDTASIANFGDLLDVVGWDVLNGTLTDGNKAYRSYSDTAAWCSLYYMETVLSDGNTLSFFRDVNKLRKEYADEHNVSFISDEDMKLILDEAANGRTIDGISASEWLYSRPVSNIYGEDGTYLSVFGNYNDGIGHDSRVNLYAFVRENGQETGLNEQNVTVRTYDADMNLIGESDFILDNDGKVEKENVGNIDSHSFDDYSAIEFIATMNYQNQEYVSRNYTIMLPDNEGDLNVGDTRMFFILTDSNGDLLNSTDDIKNVEGGEVVFMGNGLLVVEAKQKADVTIEITNDTFVYSKPYGSRIIPIKVQ